MSGRAKGLATEGTECPENGVRPRSGRWATLMVLMMAGCGLAAADEPRQPGSPTTSIEAIEQALSALASGDAASAARICADAAVQDPEGGELHACWGRALLELERWNEAERVLEIAVKAQPAADTAFNLAIARYRQKKWAEAWSACNLCLKWSEKGSRLQDRAAEIGYAIARRLEERRDREEAYAEIAKWAPETDGGREAAEELE